MAKRKREYILDACYNAEAFSWTSDETIEKTIAKFGGEIGGSGCGFGVRDLSIYFPTLSALNECREVLRKKRIGNYRISVSHGHRLSDEF